MAKSSCRLHVDDKTRLRVNFRQVAGEHYTDLVREYLIALIVYDTAPITVSIKAKPNVRSRFANLIRDGVQHFHVFRIGVVTGKGVIQLRIKGNHFTSEALQQLRREGASRAIAASRDDLHLSGKIHSARKIVQIARAKILVEAIGAAARLSKLAREHDLFQAAHFLRTESHRPLGAHFHAGPTIIIMGSSHHGDGWRVEFELREIGHRRKREANVMHMHAGAHQPGDHRELDRGGIGPVVVTRGQLQRHAHLVQQGAKTEPQRLHAHQV